MENYYLLMVENKIMGGKNFIDLISMVLLHDAIEETKTKSVKQQGPNN